MQELQYVTCVISDKRIKAILLTAITQTRSSQIRIIVSNALAK